MPRPAKCRIISSLALNTTGFKPHGKKIRLADTITLRPDEMEAIRLIDRERLYQTDAALCMGISRQTFGSILLNARRKLACALIKGKPILLGASTEQATTTVSSPHHDTAVSTRIES